MLGQNVLVAYGTVKIDEALTQAEERSLKGRATVVVGIVRNPNADCWWVCLARSRADFTWISAHRHRRQADAQVVMIERTLRRASIDDAMFQRLVDELAANADEDVLPTLSMAREMTSDPMLQVTLTESFQAARQRAVTSRANARKALAQHRRTHASGEDAPSLFA